VPAHAIISDFRLQISDSTLSPLETSSESLRFVGIALRVAPHNGPEQVPPEDRTASSDETRRTAPATRRCRAASFWDWSSVRSRTVPVSRRQTGLEAAARSKSERHVRSVKDKWHDRAELGPDAGAQHPDRKARRANVLDTGQR